MSELVCVCECFTYVDEFWECCLCEYVRVCEFSLPCLIECNCNPCRPCHSL